MASFLACYSGGMEGTCETGAAFGWRLLSARLPLLRMAVIRRPVEEVLHSLAGFGLRGPELAEELHKRDALLDQIASQLGVLSVQFRELGAPAVAHALHDHCLGAGSWDPEVWLEIEKINIQVNMPLRLARLQENHGQIEGLKAEVLAAQRGLVCPNLH